MDEPSGKIKVLLVDDEEDFLSSAARALEKRGLEVQTAQDGAEAFERIERHPVDVVVLDVKMPGLDGVEVFRRLKKEGQRLPVIILTGHGSIPQAFEVSREGVYNYLAKPCDMDDLAGMIKEAAQAHAAVAKEKKLEEDMSAAIVSVLIVDDEVELLASLKPVLERRKMTILTAQSGEEALSKLQKGTVDVVVLDIKMPGMDGLEVLQRIKRDFPAVEVLLLTGHPHVDSAMRGVKLGAREYLVKPPDVDELTRLIRKAFQNQLKEREKKQQQSVQDILKKYPD